MQQSNIKSIPPTSAERAKKELFFLQSGSENYYAAFVLLSQWRKSKRNEYVRGKFPNAYLLTSGLVGPIGNIKQYLWTIFLTMFDSIELLYFRNNFGLREVLFKIMQIVL